MKHAAIAIALVLAVLGCRLNEEVNAKIRGKEAVISTDDSLFPAVVMPTNEELMIAMETLHIVSAK